MDSRTTLIVLCTLLFWLPLKADPANVLVGDLTFVRPEKWKWEEPTARSSAITRFKVPNASGEIGSTDVRFYVEGKLDDHSDDAWKVHFPDAETEGGVRQEQKKIGKRNVTFLTMIGSYVTPELKTKVKRGYMLVSVTVPFGSQVIRVRILGPKGDVEPAVQDFRKMVEEALNAAE